MDEKLLELLGCDSVVSNSSAGSDVTPRVPPVQLDAPNSRNQKLTEINRRLNEIRNRTKQPRRRQRIDDAMLQRVGNILAELGVEGLLKYRVAGRKVSDVCDKLEFTFAGFQLVSELREVGGVLELFVFEEWISLRLYIK